MITSDIRHEVAEGTDADRAITALNAAGFTLTRYYNGLFQWVLAATTPGTDLRIAVHRPDSEILHAFVQLDLPDGRLGSTHRVIGSTGVLRLIAEFPDTAGATVSASTDMIMLSFPRAEWNLIVRGLQSASDKYRETGTCTDCRVIEGLHNDHDRDAIKAEEWSQLADEITTRTGA